MLSNSGIKSKSKKKDEALGLSISSTNQEDEAIVAFELLISGSERTRRRKLGAIDPVQYNQIGWLGINLSIDDN